MVLSSDELEILEYLKSWKGNSVSMIEICRCAGGRKKFKETPQWAKSLMARLVEANLIQVNDRGHYRVVAEEEKATPAESAKGAKVQDKKGENIQSLGNPGTKLDRWVSPQIEAILRKSGKKFQK
jgi:hypothetical protein